MLDPSELPDGWRVVRLEDVAHVNPRRPKLKVPADLPTSFIPMAAVRENCQGINAYDTRPYHEIAKGYTYFESNDVLFAKITPCLQNGKHALAAELTNGFGFGTTEFHVVRPGVELDSKHLYRVLTQPRNISKCINSFTDTAGQQRVQPEVLRSLIVLLPPISEQRAIAAVLDAIDEAIECTEALISATERLRDALLHELLIWGVPGWQSERHTVPDRGTLPEGWRMAKLGDLAEIVMGQSPPNRTVFDWDEDARYEHGLPFIQGNAEFASDHPKPKKWCNRPLKVAEHGDTLISVRAPVGETNRANCRMAIGRGLAAIRFSKAHPDYGWHMVNHAKPEFLRVAQGSTFHAIGRDDVNGLAVALPPLPRTAGHRCCPGQCGCNS